MARERDAGGWMWAQACELMEQAEGLHRRFFRPSAVQQAQVVWEPPVDLFEDEREIVLVVAMPGVGAERMQVVGEPGAIVVRGTRPVPLVPGLSVRRLEIPYGIFERRILLPSRGLELEPLEVEQGCLIVRLRKVAGP